ncbi:MAG: CHAT domain-containing protein [Planctomycetota bacterium]
MILACLVLVLLQDAAPAEELDRWLATSRELLERHRPRDAVHAAREALHQATTALVLAADLREEERQGLRSAIAHAHGALGRALRDLGDDTEAVVALATALDGLDRLNGEHVTREQGLLALDLAAVLVREGRPAAAAGALARAAETISWLEKESRGPLEVALGRLRGDLEAARGDGEGACRAWLEACELARRQGLGGEEGAIRLRLAEQSLARGDRAEADLLLAEAAQLDAAAVSPAWGFALFASVRAHEPGVGLDDCIQRLEAAARVLRSRGAPDEASLLSLEAALACIEGGCPERADELLRSVAAERNGSPRSPLVTGLHGYVAAERLRSMGRPEEVAALLGAISPEARIADALLPQLSLARARALRDLGRRADTILAYQRAWELLVRERCFPAAPLLPLGLRLDPKEVAVEIAEAAIRNESRALLSQEFAMAFRALETARRRRGEKPSDSFDQPTLPVEPEAAERLQAVRASLSKAHRRWLLRPLDVATHGLPDRDLEEVERSWSRLRRLESSEPVSVALLLDEAPSVLRVRAALPDMRAAYLAYFVGEDRSYAAAVARDRQVLVRLPGREALESLVRGVVAVWQAQDREQALIEERLAEAGDLLLAPLLEELPPVVDQLVVAPEGPLLDLPFEALRPLRFGESRRYVGETHEVLLVTSALDLLAAAQEREPHESDALAVLAVGPAAPEESVVHALSTEASAARSALRSAETLRRFVRDDAATTLIGSSASCREVEEALATPHRFVQIETLGSDGDPSGWNVLPGDLSELSPEVIEGLPLRCDLALLLGPELPGRNRQELGRAALHAGAQAVLLSRWLPSPPLASRFLEEFYGGLSRGLPVAQSLHAARMMMIRAGGESASPRSWAWLEHRGRARSWVLLKREPDWLAPILILSLSSLSVVAVVMGFVLHRMRGKTRGAFSGAGR